jgi:hypothetical protein
VHPSGTDLARAYHVEVVAPLLESRWPGLPYAAARLGGGSDVLGYDDETSRDHDWGLRLTLLVPADVVGAVDAHLQDALPVTFSGQPTRFVTTWDPGVRHHIDVCTVDEVVRSRLGVDASRPLTVADWLSLTGQSVLEVRAGPVFVDRVGALTRAREALAWYPDAVWRYVVAADWARVAQELPLVGRTGERGDDLGSRVLAARLASVLLHLAHLLDRRWPPYPKWLGTSAASLPHAGGVIEPLSLALGGASWQEREEGLVAALRLLHQVQAEAGLPVVDDPADQFWDRPFRTVRDEVVRLLEDSIDDPAVRALPRGVGSAEQWSHNVDVLVDPSRRRLGW